MSLDEIQAKDIEQSIKRDERQDRNSIRLKSESYNNTLEKTQSLYNDMYNAINAMVEEGVEAGYTDSRIRTDNSKYVNKLLKLEDEITVLNGGIVTDKAYGSRAIRLVNKMIETARDNSKGIYEELDKKEAVETPIETNETIQDTVAETVPAVETPVVDVQKISEENQKEVSESVENALSDNEINNIIDGSFEFTPVQVEEQPVVETPVVEIPAVVTEEPKLNEIEFNDSELEKIANNTLSIVNEKANMFSRPAVVSDIENEDKINEIIDDFVNSSKYEYKAMSDAEVEAARKKLELDKYEKEIRKYAEDKFAEKGISRPVMQDENIREEVEIVPPREEKIEEFTMEVENYDPVIVNEDVAPREVATPVEESNKYKEDGEEKVTDFEAELKRVKEQFEAKKKLKIEKEEAYSYAVEKQEEAEKRIENAKAALVEKQRKLIEKYQRKIDDIDSDINSMDNDIEKIKANTIKTDANARKAEESVYDLELMLNSPEDDEEYSNYKVR